MSYATGSYSRNTLSDSYSDYSDSFYSDDSDHGVTQKNDSKRKNATLKPHAKTKVQHAGKCIMVNRLSMRCEPLRVQIYVNCPKLVII